MKKLFLGFMAIAAMASCVKEQTVVAPEQHAISFSEFVTNSNTKTTIDPTYSNPANKLDAFYVWGFMTSNTGEVFSKEKVWYDETLAAWTYSNLAYWAPKKTYKFAALAPVSAIDSDVAKLTLAVDEKYMTNDGALGTVAFTNENGTVDLLYATDEVTTQDVIASNPEKVQFTFKHLLSKVKFTFTNGLSNEKNTIKVTDVKMVVPTYGSLDLTKAPLTWVVTNNATSTLEFGNVYEVNDDTFTANQLKVGQSGEVQNERLTIPVTTTSSLISSYEVSFKVTLYNGTEEGQTIDMTSTITDKTFEPGKCYNFTATLNANNLKLQAIEFDEPIVENWVHGADFDFLN